MENGWRTSVGGMEFRFGQMEPNTKVSGKMEKLMVRVLILLTQASSFTLTEIFTKGSGEMTKRRVKGFINTTMELDMRVSGLMITNTEKESRLGLTEVSTKELTLRGRKTVREHIDGRTALITKVNGKTIKSTVMVFTSGQTGDSTKASG